MIPDGINTSHISVAIDVSGILEQLVIGIVFLLVQLYFSISQLFANF